MQKANLIILEKSILTRARVSGLSILQCGAQVEELPANKDVIVDVEWDEMEDDRTTKSTTKREIQMDDPKIGREKKDARAERGQCKRRLQSSRLAEL